MNIHCWIISLLLAAAFVFFAVGQVAERIYGFERVLEHGADWTLGQLEELRSKPAAGTQVTQAKRYAFPILFPLDLIEMILIAGACAVASVVWARYVHLGSFAIAPACVPLLLILPCAYLAADLAEDSLLAFLLTSETVQTQIIPVVRVLTTLKLWLVKLAMLQTLVIICFAGWAYLRGS